MPLFLNLDLIPKHPAASAHLGSLGAEGRVSQACGPFPALTNLHQIPG